MTDSAVDPRITKRRVTMTNYAVEPNDEGRPSVTEYKVEDHVLPAILDAYVADAKTRWQSVVVSDEPDAGPAGYDGATYIPAALPVPDAGLYFPATSGSDAEKAAVKAGDPLAIATEGSDEPVLLTAVLSAIESSES